MQIRRLALVSTGVLAAALALSGCGKNSIATVNGDSISKDEFYSRLERLPIPNSNGQSIQAGPAVLNQMVEDTLWEQLAKEKKVEPTEAQINKRIEWQKKAEDLAGQLRQQGMSADEYKKLLRPKLAKFNVLTKGISITNNEIKAAYEQNKNKPPFTKPAQTKIAIIMAMSQQKINDAYGKIKSGANFGEVAAQMSEDQATKASKGELGWIYAGRPGVPKQVIDTAASLRANGVCEPFPIPVGQNKSVWCIVKALQKQPEINMSFDDSRDFIHDAIAESKAARDPNIAKVFQEKFASSKIKLGPDKYKGLQENLEKAQKDYKAHGSKKP